jgi:outer membrane protein OmpA-like peptidoglycan-associated protein
LLGPAAPRGVANGRDTVLGLGLGLSVDRFVCSHFSVGATLDYLFSTRAYGTMREIHALRPGLTAGYWFGASGSKTRPVAEEPAPAPRPAPVVAEAPKPEPAPAAAKPAPAAKVQITLAVQFDTAKSEVKPQYDGELQKVAKFLKDYPSTKAEIEGHTDNVGGAAYNKRLSQRRADAVRQALIDRFGCDGSRLSAMGYGEDKPIADNGNAAGRAKNRRVVATFTSAN